jgi:hypothetical protein
MNRDLWFRNMRERQQLDKMYEDTAKKIDRSFEKNYQKWYTNTHVVLKQLLPDRLEEFMQLYRPDFKRKQIDRVGSHRTSGTSLSPAYIPPDSNRNVGSSGRETVPARGPTPSDGLRSDLEEGDQIGKSAARKST